MLRFCVRWIERGVILLSAFFAMQFPAFLQNYLAHVTGHLAELNYLVGRFSEVAASVHKTLFEWIQKLLQNSDPDIVMQGQLLATILERQGALAKAEMELAGSSLLAKPFYFIQSVEPSIVKEAFADFHLSLPISTEGGIYALVGALIGWLLFTAITLPFRISKKKKVNQEKEISQ